MSDIIQYAKDLLVNISQKPWHAFLHRNQVTGSDGSSIVPPANKPRIPDIQLIAAAPELAQSLAEETWEYSAQEKRGADWETFTNSETHLEEWWADKDDAEWAAIISQEQGHETRIVRRRVSPPEVVG